MKRRSLLIIGLVALLSLALAACNSQPDTAELTITMSDFAFDPADVSVPAGAEVTLTLINEGSLEHEWVIVNQGMTVEPPVDEAAVEAEAFFEAEAQAGATKTVTFTAPSEPGEYQIVCVIPGHLEQGMEGTLTVTE